MKSIVRLTKRPLLAVALGLLAVPAAFAQQPDPRLLVAKSENAREAVMRENMLLDAEESKNFWPLYKEYRAQMGPVHEQLIDLVVRYADLYPHVSDEQATKLFDGFLSVKDQQSKIQSKYLKKFRKLLRPKQAIRFAQIENKLDAAVEFDAAVNVPLVN